MTTQTGSQNTTWNKDNRPKRKALPNRRGGYRQKFVIGGQTVYLGTGEYEDGTLGEIFLDASRTGTVVRALLQTVAISVSRGLQYGVPIEEYISSFKDFDFAPSGDVVGDSRIKEAYSILAYVFTELEETYVKKNPYIPNEQPIGSEWDTAILAEDSVSNAGNARENGAGERNEYAPKPPPLPVFSQFEKWAGRISSGSGV